MEGSSPPPPFARPPVYHLLAFRYSFAKKVSSSFAGPRRSGQGNSVPARVSCLIAALWFAAKASRAGLGLSFWFRMTVTELPPVSTGHLGMAMEAQGYA